MSENLTLCSGPIYFFDQPVGRKCNKRTRKVVGELPADLRYLNINPRLAAFIRSRSKKSASEDNSADDDGDSKLIEDVKKKEKHSVLPLINNDPSHSLSKNSSAEDPTLQPVSSSLGDHAQTSQIDEYKYAAPTLLEELGEMLLEYEGCEEVNFPRGLLNILNCSWKELVEGAVYSKRQQQSLACKSMKHLKLRSSVHSEKFSEDVADKQLHGKSKPKKRVTRAENAIERGMGVHFKQETKGQKRDKQSRKGSSPAEKDRATQPLNETAQVSHLPLTITFSISSKICEEQGWIVQQEESKPQDPEWKALCAWAVERLRLAQVPINEQTSNLKEAGFSKPVILRHYGDAKNKAFAKYKKQGSKNCSFTLVNGRPVIPELKQEDPSLQKLHYTIIDGSSFIYYPSGRIAVCQSYSGLPCGGFYTNVFSDSSDPYTLATFTPFGHASVCHPGSHTVALLLDQDGGILTDEEGTVTKEWNWAQGVKLNETVLIQVNDFISVRVVSPTSINLSYRWQQESVQVSLSPLTNVIPPGPDELGFILTGEKLSSKASKELSKANRKKMMEIEARKKFMAKKSEATKSSNEFSKLVKMLEIPEEGPSHVRGVEAAQELRKLQRKIKNILDDWMEHYRIATGISSPDISKMSSTPQRTILKRKTKSAASPSLVPIDVEWKETDAVQPQSNNPEASPFRFLSAPARNILWDPPKSSQSSRTFSSVSVNVKEEPTVITGNLTTRIQNTLQLGPVIHKSPKNYRPLLSSHNPCPVLLRSVMMGEGEKKRCRCSNHQTPYLTDLEYDAFITGQMPGIEQIVVVCVVSSSNPQSSLSVDILEKLYEKKNKNRSMPCVQCRLDSFRLVKYDIATAGTQTVPQGSLLLQRHNVAPGMFLMYICGKLLFADYIFNGYSSSIKDLQKQISITRGNYRMGLSLPSDFRFSPHREISESNTTQGAQGECSTSSQRDSCQSKAPLHKDKSTVQVADRAVSVQESVTFNMSKRSHLLCDRKKKNQPSFTWKGHFKNLDLMRIAK